MAKYRHRIFEMYDLRDEAVRALTPRVEKTATELTPPETWTFTHLQISRVAGVIHVRFREPWILNESADRDLGDDLTRLNELLGRDSKVLLDFSGVVSFDVASVGLLARFNRNLQTRGSRMVLCCLQPGTRDAFFKTS